MEIARDVEAERSGGGPPNQSSNGGFRFQSSGGEVSCSNTAGGTNNDQNATGSGRVGQSNGRLGAMAMAMAKPGENNGVAARNQPEPRIALPATRDTSSQPLHQNRSHCVEIKLNSHGRCWFTQQPP